MARQAWGWKLNCNVSVSLRWDMFFDGRKPSTHFAVDSGPRRLKTLARLSVGGWTGSEVQLLTRIREIVYARKRVLYHNDFVRMSWLSHSGLVRKGDKSAQTVNRSVQRNASTGLSAQPIGSLWALPLEPFMSTVRSESLSRGPQGGRERAEHAGSPWQWGQHRPVERGYGCTCAIEARVLVVWFCQCSLTNWPCGSFLRLLSMYGKSSDTQQTSLLSEQLMSPPPH